MSVATNKYTIIPGLPVGVIGGIEWYHDSKSLGFSFRSYNTPSDVFEYDIDTKKLIRWTESEMGGMDISGLSEPKLISWKSFDDKTISGYLYKASSKFTGKRPVNFDDALYR